MTISLNQFPGDTKHKFDVLNSQLGDEYKGYRIPIRFEDLPKPTELPPFRPQQHVEKEVAPEVKPEVRPEQTPDAPKFKAPHELYSYIHTLGNSGRKLKSLSFDIQFAETTDDIETILNREVDAGRITSAERSDLLAFLPKGGEKISVIEEKLIPVVKEESMPENPATVIDGGDTDPARIKRKKLQNLRDNHGILVHGAETPFSDLENKIIDKSNKTWKGDERDARLSEMLLDGADLKFPIVEEKSIPDSIPKDAEEEEIASFGFEGKLVQIEKSGDGGVRVLFEGKEIAAGTPAHIEMHKEFKGGLLLAKTEEEKAFAEAKKRFS